MNEKTSISLTPDGLLDRLKAGPVICAEGYLFELERRGYVQAGAFVPEVVLEHPEIVQGLHREFVHAGSDVVEAFTYYAHREKLRLIGKEDQLELMNRSALMLAREVARETGSLLAGDICNTNIYTGSESDDAVQSMFKEQVEWAADEGVDFIIAETLSFVGEAVLAVEAIVKAGLPAVATLAFHQETVSRDGLTPVEACKRLEAAGASVVGLNCIRGPQTMLPLLEDIRGAVDCHLAALPVPYRTYAKQPTFQSLTDPSLPGGQAFPFCLDPFTCSRHDIDLFTKAAAELGATYFGLCCGAAPHHIRAMAEALGKTPPASRYSPDMSKHAFLGTDSKLLAQNQAYAGKL